MTGKIFCEIFSSSKTSELNYLKTTNRMPVPNDQCLTMEMILWQTSRQTCNRTLNISKSKLLRNNNKTLDKIGQSSKMKWHRSLDKLSNEREQANEVLCTGTSLP